MKALLLSLMLLCGAAQAMDRAALTEADAVKAVNGGFCGFMPLGTGLVNGKGWLHQPTTGTANLTDPTPPAMVEVRTASAAGTIQTPEMKTLGIAPQHTISIPMQAGKPYYVVVSWAMTGDHLEWHIPGYAWGPVPVGFQLAPL